MDQIEIGQRVRVIDGGLTEYKQYGTVVALGSSDSYYVHLDTDELPDTENFFQVEELEVVSEEVSPDDAAMSLNA